MKFSELDFESAHISCKYALSIFCVCDEYTFTCRIIHTCTYSSLFMQAQFY